eukprot:453001-Pelagomonas_calceolata.AAC.2
MCTPPTKLCSGRLCPDWCQGSGANLHRVQSCIQKLDPLGLEGPLANANRHPIACSKTRSAKTKVLLLFCTIAQSTESSRPALT